MEVLLTNSSSITYDNNKRNLQQLLEAFGSVVSLTDIASAYSQAGRDVYEAGELLCKHGGSTSSTSHSSSKDELEVASSSDNILGRSDGERNSMAPKQRKGSVSMGTVSGVIGKEFGRTWPSTNEPHEVTKPLKLDSSELPASQIWSEQVPDGMATSGTMKKDVEKFLFSMLGDGFRLNMNVIREVLGFCGCDVTKSFEKLLDLSALAEKSEDVLCTTTQKPMEKSVELEALVSPKKSQSKISGGSSGTGVLIRNESELPKRDNKNRYDLEKEVLESLFTIPERVEEAPKRIVRRSTGVTRRTAFGSLVVEPPRDDITTEHGTFAKPKVIKDETDENENSYNKLRISAKEFWITMKEYYKSAIDAFTKGDRTLADKLMKQGQFYAYKAREANDKSAQKLLKISDEEEEVPLDLHDHEPKEAVRLLKFHLTSLSGIPSVPHLKVLVGASHNDPKGAARKNRILELLDEEYIKWTEEGNGDIIVIKVDGINPKSQFCKESTVLNIQR